MNQASRLVTNNRNFYIVGLHRDLLLVLLNRYQNTELHNLHKASDKDIRDVP